MSEKTPEIKLKNSISFNDRIKCNNISTFDNNGSNKLFKNTRKEDKEGERYVRVCVEGVKN